MKLETVGKNWGWVLAGGLTLMFLGIVTLNWPVSSTVSLTFALGIMLIASGVVHTVHALQMRHKPGLGWRLLQTLASVAAGVLMLRYPLAGMEGIAIAMTFYFFVSAAAKSLIAFSLRPVRGWGWILASAVASAGIGVYVLVALPAAALWVPGFLVGIDFVLYGASLVGISLDLKHIQRSVSDITQTKVRFET